MEVSAAGSVAGIDVGWSELRKSSAVCRLDWTSHEIAYEIVRTTAQPAALSASIHRVIDRPVSCVAIDGPLRKGFDEIGTYRIAEQMLTNQKLAIGKPGQSSSPNGKLLNRAANNCAKLAIATGHVGSADHSTAIAREAVVEAFPTSFLGCLIDEPPLFNRKRKKRSDAYFFHLTKSGGLEQLLRHLLPGRALVRPLDSVRDHDDRAGLICAITALCVTCRQFTAVGDDNNGWIILPPRWALAERVWSCLSLGLTDRRLVVVNA